MSEAVAATPFCALRAKVGRMKIDGTERSVTHKGEISLGLFTLEQNHQYSISVMVLCGMRLNVSYIEESKF